MSLLLLAACDCDTLDVGNREFYTPWYSILCVLLFIYSIIFVILNMYTLGLVMTFSAFEYDALQEDTNFRTQANGSQPSQVVSFVC